MNPEIAATKEIFPNKVEVQNLPENSKSNINLFVISRITNLPTTKT